jgi:hypothetical protein
MGLLNFLPDDPNEKAAMRKGLLDLGAAMLSGHGSFANMAGQGLAAGSQGYQGSLAAQQQKQLSNAQLERWNLDNQQTKAAIAEPGNIARIISGQPQEAAAPSAASALAGGASTANVQPQPLISGQPSGGVLPLSALPVAGAQATPAKPASLYDTYMGYGDRLTQAGKPAAAKQYYELAEKQRPKLKEIRNMTTPDGKRVAVSVNEDGSFKQVDGFAPDAEKLAFGSTGGAYEGRDQFTGKVISSTPMTQTPDSIANGKITMRGQNMVDARAKESNNKVDPVQTENVAQMIADGRMAPLGQMAMRSPAGVAIMSRVAEINPQFRSQTFGTGSKAEKDFATGKQGNSVRSFNVSLTHLDTLDKLADALHNKDTQAINKVGNFFASQTGGEAPTNFDAAKKIVADEIVKAIVGSGGGVADREEAARVIDKANSPAQLKGVIKTYKELMRGQLHGLEGQYKATTGRDDFDKYLSPEARAQSHGAATAATAAYSDAEKERRYQAYVKAKAGK